MSRFFEIFADGELHRYLEDDLPLIIGRADTAHVHLAAGNAVEGRIGLHEGRYLYLQPATGATDIFHNDKLVSDSAWIKSGDRTRIGDQLLLYRISGDLVEINLVTWPGPDSSSGEQSQGSLSPEYGGPAMDSTMLPRLDQGFNGSSDPVQKNIVLGLVFLMLLLAAMFVLIARSVEIRIDPKPERLSLHGMLPLLPLGDRFLGVVGNYRLEASRTGYQDLQAEVVIQRSGFSHYSFSLEKLPGLLDITSTPVGAEVFLDEKKSGHAPLTALQISAGTHELRCKLERYQDVRQDLEVRGLGARQSVDCVLAPAWGKVFVVTDPAEATIIAEKGEIGKTPQTVELDLGKHHLVLRKTGYKDFKLDIIVAAGKTLVPQMVLLERKSIQVQPALQPAAVPEPPDSSSGGKTPVKAVSPRPEPVPGAVVRDSAGAAEIRPILSGNEPEMLRLKPAFFTMGTSRREPGRRANESKRQVEITRPFLLGMHEITNGEYRRFKPGHHSGFLGGLTLDGDRQPVVNISWQDAARYCNWLSVQQGLAPFYREQGGTLIQVHSATNGYRLPFEAEWAYVARMVGRTQPGRYPWDGGFPPRTRNGNYADESARTLLPVVIKGYYDGFPVTAPVDSFPSNMGGFFDMGGNVSEWCHDFYSPYLGPVSGKSVDPTGPASGSYYVVRGSSWRDGAMTELRFSFRGYSKKFKDSLGFRVARYTR